MTYWRKIKWIAIWGLKAGAPGRQNTFLFVLLIDKGNARYFVGVFVKPQILFLPVWFFGNCSLVLICFAISLRKWKMFSEKYDICTQETYQAFLAEFSWMVEWLLLRKAASLSTGMTRLLQQQRKRPIQAKISFNPSSPNSDQHQISPCNTNAYSTPEVMRIKDMITQGEFSWYFNNFSKVLL